MAVITYKCPNCGGGLQFDPGTQKYTCEFCGSSFTQEQLDELAPSNAKDQKAEQIDVGETQSAGDEAPEEGEKQAGEAVLYTCPSCGAEIVTDETTAATFCYYCHNPVVLEGKLSGEYLPDRILPFKIDRKKAEQGFLDFVHHKKFVPKSFFSRQQIEKLSGVYYPYWMYDCELDGGITGKATNIRTWIAGDMEFTETNIFHFEREGDVNVQNLSRNALKESDRRLIDAVLPYRMNEVTDFRLPMLQGFVAQRRDVESKDVSQELLEKARNYAQTAERNTVTGYDNTSIEHSDFRVVRESWQYLLLPVWVLTYGSSNGQKYYFAMNGQTGETHGRLPVDTGKLAAVSSVAAAAVIALSVCLSYFVF